MKPNERQGRLRQETVGALLTGLFVLGLAFLIAAVPAAADGASRPFLHGLFTNDMVLQRDMPVRIWGWTKPGEKVSVSIAGRKGEAVAAADGGWTVTLAPSPAGGPYLLSVSGSEKINLANVMFGDVWLCSGQSNMGWDVRQSVNGQQETAAANYPDIRLFLVPNQLDDTPRVNVASIWRVCTPETVARFSAVAYFFGRNLQRDLNVPIGLIASSWSATIAEGWTSLDALHTLPEYQKANMDYFISSRNKVEEDVKVYQSVVEEWWRGNDPGSAPGAGWESTDLDTSGWLPMQAPGRSAGNGVTWFRKEVELPADWAGRDLELWLGHVNDKDSTWFNGTLIGSRDWPDHLREYIVPRELVKPGRNVIGVRALSLGAACGLTGPADRMLLRVARDCTVPALPLAGEWRCRVSVPATGLKSEFPKYTGSRLPIQGSAIYNAMIAPLSPLALKGVIWYQGEHNAGNARLYRRLLPTLIGDWRTAFRQDDMPFLIVQLANYMERKAEPSDSKWAELREAQLMTTQSLPHTGLAVAIDIGDAADIHPKNKQDVGKRLELAALALVYGRKMEYSGPIYDKMEIRDGKVVLKFKHTEGGLTARGGALRGFAVCGADRKYAWAEAVIEGDTVVVSSAGVPQPLAVRYGWADNPDCNLYNGAGLPASPFRTGSEEK